MIFSVELRSQRSLLLSLAYMEMRLLLAKMFYGFELRLHDEGLDWDGETTIRTFWRKPDLMVEFESR